MKIYYPPLVEQAASFIGKYYQKDTKEIKRDKLYRSLVEHRILTETAEPTVEALQKGYIKDYYEAADLTFAEFLSLYPVFKQYEKSLFKKIGEFWEIPIDFKDELLKKLNQKYFNYDDKIALESYFSERNIK